ncbi:MAG TPA: hypothetical protein VMJ65_14725 [Solirubrobacteraceae bacterium]|nr:hypothetical protein [Solirubrobacteraceae bacterium]
MPAATAAPRFAALTREQDELLDRLRPDCRVVGRLIGGDVVVRTAGDYVIAIEPDGSWRLLRVPAPSWETAA